MAERQSLPASREGTPSPDAADVPALVLAGHGSHYDPDSSAPVRDCADRLRDRWAGPVRTAFWKEDPSLRAVLRTIPADRAVVIPVMTSGGYFVDQVFPRELGLESGRAASDPERPDPAVGADVAVAYADPVGTHEALTDVVVEHAADVTGGAAPAPEFALALVGHGTERDPNSAAATLDHAERLRESGAFGEVRALFMDEAPTVEALHEHVAADRVVVVPLFVANGYHVTEDIPADLGLPLDDDGDWPVPADVAERRIWYADAVGTHASLVDVALGRAREGAAKFEDRRGTERRAAPDAEVDPDAEAEVERAGAAFRAWLHEGDAEPSTTDATGPSRRWGQLSAAVVGDDEYALRHVDDREAATADLDALADVAALRDRIRFDDVGRYRPLSGARTLPTGWRLSSLGPEDLVRAVEAVYPTSVVDWYRERTGDLEPAAYDAVAGRQTGLYADVDDLQGDALAAAVEACCGGCARRRAWAASDEAHLDAEAGDGSIPCREPCSFVLSAAREFLAVEASIEADDLDDADRAVDRSVRPGDVDERGNVYRARYLAAREGADVPSVRPLDDAAAGGEVEP